MRKINGELADIYSEESGTERPGLIAICLKKKTLENFSQFQVQCKPTVLL